MFEQALLVRLQVPAGTAHDHQANICLGYLAISTVSLNKERQVLPRLKRTDTQDKVLRQTVARSDRIHEITVVQPSERAIDAGGDGPYLRVRDSPGLDDVSLRVLRLSDNRLAQTGTPPTSPSKIQPSF